jgi:hypothetical protein
MQAFFLIMYELWALTADLSEFPERLDDPDQPLQTINKNSKKPEQTGVSMYQCIQLSSCIHEFFTQYLGDKTSTGMCSSFVLLELIPFTTSSFFYEPVLLRQAPQHGLAAGPVLSGQVHHS